MGTPEPTRIQTEPTAAEFGSVGSVAGTRVEAARVRGSEPGAGGVVAPSGPTGERAFFAERLALFARIACIASAGFLVMRVVMNALSNRAALALPRETFPWWHLAATATFFFLWMFAGSRGWTERALRRLDAGGTIVAAVGYAFMATTMTLSWRPDQLGVLILNAVLLGRAALVPSEPRRTAWISFVSVAGMPLAAWWIFRGRSTPELPAAGVIVQTILWSTFTALLATLISSVTFHLRRSVARARRLGQYTLLDKLGEGGMGVVYRAEHEMLRRPTAIKLLPPHFAGEEGLRRFEREAQLTARLTNPHTVSVYDYGRTPEGAFYYVMEYLDGMDLERLVKETGPMPPGRVVHVLEQVCEALAEAHGIGLIHRDIKPANVVLSDRGGIPDFAKVLDYGLVKDVASPAGESGGPLTQENVIAGTPQYLAPESIRDGTTTDPRSDLYSLGAVAYFLLTGTAVFEGRPMEVISKHMTAEPEPPSKRLGRPVPPKLEALVLELLEKDPADRPESADEVRRRLIAAEKDAEAEPWTAESARDWWRARRSA